MRSAGTGLESQPQVAGVSSCDATKTARSFSVWPHLDVAMDLVEPVEVDEALQRPRHNRTDLLLGEAAAGGLRRWRMDSVRVRAGGTEALQHPAQQQGWAGGEGGKGSHHGSRRASMISQSEEPSQNSMTIHSSGPRWKEP